jgi:predicted nucleic acid-binding protein
LVKLFVAETGSSAMIKLAEQTDDTKKLISALAMIEVRSAIRRRQYAGDTSQADAEFAVLALIEESRRLMQYPLTPLVLELAVTLVDQRNLRALDSIQLASVGSDTKLIEAAAAEGFTVWNPA